MIGAGRVWIPILLCPILVDKHREAIALDRETVRITIFEGVYCFRVAGAPVPIRCQICLMVRAEVEFVQLS